MRNSQSGTWAFSNLSARPADLTYLLMIVVLFVPLSVLVRPGSIHSENAARSIGDNLLGKIEQRTISATLVHSPSSSSWWDVSLWTLFL